MIEARIVIEGKNKEYLETFETWEEYEEFAIKTGKNGYFVVREVEREYWLPRMVKGIHGIFKDE